MLVLFSIENPKVVETSKSFLRLVTVTADDESVKMFYQLISDDAVKNYDENEVIPNINHLHDRLGYFLECDQIKTNIKLMLFSKDQSNAKLDAICKFEKQRARFQAILTKDTDKWKIDSFKIDVSQSESSTTLPTSVDL